MTDLALFRVYEPHELGRGGYPRAWYDVSGDGGVKDLVREEAGHRCVRCGHPFVVGESGVMEGPSANAKAFAAELGLNVETLDTALQFFEGDVPLGALDRAPRTNWSPCDERCTHAGPVRCGAYGALPDDPETLARHKSACDAPHEAAWRILTVHHLNGVKHDLRWWNLIACCQRCHLWLQGTVQLERVYPWEHDEYFKPYAAGWYAYAYLGEALTREETLERLDELLALERVA